MDELKPCTCGITEQDHDEGSPLLELDGSDDGLWRVICHGCGMNTGWHVNDDVARKTWNARTEAKVTGEVVRKDLVEKSYESLTVGEHLPFVRVVQISDAMAILLKYLHLHAPQSPVVPGVEELQILCKNVLNTVAMEDGRTVWDEILDHERALDLPRVIHAHLLANARESRDEAHNDVAFSMASESVEALIDRFQDDSDVLAELTVIKEALATVGKEG